MYTSVIHYMAQSANRNSAPEGKTKLVKKIQRQKLQNVDIVAILEKVKKIQSKFDAR